MTKRHRTPKVLKPETLKRPSDIGLDYLFTGEIDGSKVRNQKREGWLKRKKNL